MSEILSRKIHNLFSNETLESFILLPRNIKHLFECRKLNTTHVMTTFKAVLQTSQ